MLKKLFSRKQLPVLVGIVLVFGLFGGVLVSQQRQETRSNAAETTCPNRASDLHVNNCTVNGDFQGNMYGNGNLITGRYIGNLTGHGNEVCAGMIGNLTGNNNTIHQGLTGNNNGTGNNLSSSAACGSMRITPTPIPSPTPTPSPTTVPSPTPSPTSPPATCADGIDNNQNELIDAGDPACHTGGNLNNPYDPTRNEGTVNPTVTTPPSRCSDNIDNDNNGFKDNLDSTCHTDNNPNNPNSYDPTRPGEQGGNGATCADSRDNNNNGLIDGGDPICHTDGSASNPNSYDHTRAEGGTTPSPTITPTSTPAPGNTTLSLTLLLHGIGQGGDSANPASGGNPDPLHPQRNVRVEVLNAQNQLVATKDGAVNYNSTSGKFTGNIDMGSAFVTGAYTVKVKTNQFLKSLVPGIQTITAGTTNQMPQTVLINGEINGDNVINILDYNILMGCYSDFLPAVSCTAANNLLSDLDDDGAVNQFDYNLFLRELTNRQGV